MWERNFFATYIDFAKKSLGLNIVTYVFDNVIKVVLSGQETVNKVKYISKEFYRFMIYSKCSSAVHKMYVSRAN